MFHTDKPIFKKYKPIRKSIGLSICLGDHEYHVLRPTFDMQAQTGLYVAAFALPLIVFSALRRLHRNSKDTLPAVPTQSTIDSEPRIDAYDKIKHPVWVDHVRSLFTHPLWVPTDKTRKCTGMMWQGCMKPNVDLFAYSKKGDTFGVKEWSVTIYEHLRSRTMPIGKAGETVYYWPESATDMLRRWVNQGSRETTAEKIKKIVPPPIRDPIVFPAPDSRRDILTYTEAEINELRAAWEEHFQPDQLVDKNGNPTPWQQMGNLHRFWCLHHQEAFLPWHRCYMRHFEQVLGKPLPYWNWSAADVGDPKSKAFGIPQCFRDETYVHPRTKKTRLNPLRWAKALDGKSLATTMYKDKTTSWTYPTPPELPGYPKSEDTSWAQVAPEFFAPVNSPSYIAKMRELATFSSQVHYAMSHEQ